MNIFDCVDDVEYKHIYKKIYILNDVTVAL